MPRQTPDSPSPRRAWWLAGAAVALAAAVAGCGAVVRDAVARDEAVGVVGGGYALAGTGAFDGPLAHARPGLALASKLGLSAEQRQKARAIALKYRADLRPANTAAARQALAAIMLAPAVDEARLAAFIRTHAAAFEAKKPVRLAMAQELRGVLTPAQRETLAGLLEAGESGIMARADAVRGKVRAHAAKRFGLTDAQLAKADAVHARVEALRQDPRKDALRLAAAGFVRTGDAAALSAALPALGEVLPVAEIVDLAASLDLRQRQQIAAQARRFAAMRLGPHPF